MNTTAETYKERIEQLVLVTRMMERAENDKREDDAKHYKKKVERYSHNLERDLREMSTRLEE